jgi:N-acetylglucosaminyldiphosphoundecaprenol N-acetyl-beta-D-mannosaminyltransferase
MMNSNCKVVNIPLTLDYMPEKTSELSNKVITYIGRLSEEKGVIDLIEVFKKIHDKDDEFRLNIVGDGELKEKMIQKISENHLESCAFMQGYKSKSELEEIMLNTSIGINTSYTESFGLALMETFSYGIPCVAFSSAEGAKEIIDNDKNGYIIENRNFEEMANKVIDLVNNKDKLMIFGKNAREKSEQFEVRNIKEKWFKLVD